jgi:hypothetical protein
MNSAQHKSVSELTEPWSCGYLAATDIQKMKTHWSVEVEAAASREARDCGFLARDA